MYCKSAICKTKSGQFELDSVINWKPVYIVSAGEVMVRNEVPLVQHMQGNFARVAV